MRVALISDIHANFIALETVLADIVREGIDQTVFLGDLVTLGPQPKEVAARLRELNCPCVMGNHDTFILNVDQLHEGEHGAWYIETAQWCAAQLSAVDFDYLRTFQPWLKIQLDPHEPEVSLFCFHGSPKSNMDFIFSTTPAEELEKMVAGHTAPVMAGGHTHIQMVRRHQGTMIVNVGSVGMPLAYFPFEGNPPALPWAEYAIISWSNSRLGIELRQVAVDLKAVRQAALTSDNPHMQAWAEMWSA